MKSTNAEIIAFPTLKAISSDLLLEKFNDDSWLDTDDMRIEINGHRYWHEDVYFELADRGIAPPI